MTRALVLAAGFGTRLGALSDELPKPLLPVCDVPLLRYAIALLAGHGIRELAVNLHHKGELIERALGDGSAFGVSIRYAPEETILGTGGPLRRLGDWLSEGGREPFFVVNGKIVIDVDLDEVRARHRASDAAATMVLKETPDAEKWGAIEVADDGRVTRILKEGRAGAKKCMFTGVHLLEPRLVARLPEGESDSIRQGYLPALAAGERIEGFVLDGYFHEHSTPARYLEGNWNLLRGKARLRHPPAPLTGADPTATLAGAHLVPPFRIAPGALVEPGATVGPDVVVGARARVRSGARLERVVVWPEATAEGSLSDAIVTPRGVQVVG